MRPTVRSLLARATGAALLVLLFAAPPANARTLRNIDGVVRTIRPTDVVDGGSLSTIFSVLTDKTFVFKRGTYDLAGVPAILRGRSDRVTICGATGRSGDVVLTTTGQFALFVDQCKDVEVRDLTIRTEHVAGEAVHLNGFTTLGGGQTDSFADDMLFRGCTLEGHTPIGASIRVNALTVKSCTIRVLQTAGVGIIWNDGRDLFVSGCKFRTGSGVLATAGVRVQGPLDPASNGERARTIVLSKNDVNGDFTFGFDLIDVTDARVRKNRITFPGPTQGGGNLARVGIFVRRLVAADVPDDIELFRNRVRKALFGAWFDGVGPSSILRNDFRRNGSTDTNNGLGLRGGAVLMSLITGNCRTDIERNDFRNLKTPVDEPAVVERSGFDLSDCFPPNDRNKKQRNRPLYTGEQP